GTLYRGSKPVMWSVVEKTALAEAEVEYEDYTSDTILVKFPLREARDDYAGEVAGDPVSAREPAIVIWTTTPWTIPGNRALAFSSKIAYGLYEVTDAPADNWAKRGDRLILADKLADEVMKQARVAAFRRVQTIAPDFFAGKIA